MNALWHRRFSRSAFARGLDSDLRAAVRTRWVTERIALVHTGLNIRNQDPPNTDLRWMHIGVCDDRDRRWRSGFFSNIVWKTISVDKIPGETQVVVSDMHGVLETPVCEIRGSISNDFETIPIFDYKLGDLEGNPFAFFVTRNIASRIARILITANEYVIFSSERDSLNFSEHDYKFQWPLKFTEDELKEPWIRVMYEYDASRFNFSRYTPIRFFRPKTISLPKVDS